MTSCICQPSRDSKKCSRWWRTRMSSIPVSHYVLAALNPPSDTWVGAHIGRESHWYIFLVLLPSLFSSLLVTFFCLPIWFPFPATIEPKSTRMRLQWVECSRCLWSLYAIGRVTSFLGPCFPSTFSWLDSISLSILIIVWSCVYFIYIIHAHTCILHIFFLFFFLLLYHLPLYKFLKVGFWINEG